MRRTFVALALLAGHAQAAITLADPFATNRYVSASVEKGVTAHEGRAGCQFDAVIGQLDLLMAVERALCNNTETRQAWTKVKAQVAQLGIAESRYLPTADATLGASKQVARSAVTNFSYLNRTVHADVRDMQLNASWVLFDFGQRRANLDNARQLLAAADANQDGVLQAVFASTAQAYYDLQKAQAVLAASEEAEAAANESFKATEARFDAGAGSLADKLQTQTTLGQARLARLKADGELGIAHGTLAVAMGLRANSPYTLAPAPAALAEKEAFATIDAMIDAAVQEHPKLKALRAEVRAAEHKVAMVRAEGRPTLAMTLGMSRTDQIGQYPGDSYYRDRAIGFQLKVPLFEGGARSYQVRSAKVALEAKEIDVQDAERQVSLDVWSSYQALGSNAESIKATEELLAVATDSFHIAQGRYKAGVGTIIELLDAQRALANAQQQRIESVANWRIARLRLAASLGKLGLWAIR
jgi:outer membrane protein